MLTMQVLLKQNSDYAYDASFAKAKLLGGTYDKRQVKNFFRLFQP
jgi:hypothetical protein